MLQRMLNYYYRSRLERLMERGEYLKALELIGRVTPADEAETKYFERQKLVCHINYLKDLSKQYLREYESGDFKGSRNLLLLMQELILKNISLFDISNHELVTFLNVLKCDIEAKLSAPSMETREEIQAIKAKHSALLKEKYKEPASSVLDILVDTYLMLHTTDEQEQD